MSPHSGRERLMATPKWIEWRRGSGARKELGFGSCHFSLRAFHRPGQRTKAPGRSAAHFFSILAPPPIPPTPFLSWEEEKKLEAGPRWMIQDDWLQRPELSPHSRPRMTDEMCWFACGLVGFSEPQKRRAWRQRSPNPDSTQGPPSRRELSPCRPPSSLSRQVLPIFLVEMPFFVVISSISGMNFSGAYA